MVIRRILLLLLLAASLTAQEASRSPAAGSLLATRIGEVTARAEFRNANWGVLIVDPATGETLHEQNAHKLFPTASTAKLYSVATALDAFGPAYHFETSVYRRGDQNASGELTGDLILVAGGDLTLGGRTDATGKMAFTDVDHTYANVFAVHALTGPDPLAGLDELARQVRASGLTRLHGDVLADDRLFEKAKSTGSGPSVVTPLMVNDNLIDFLITPTQAGAAATLDVRPGTRSIVVDARVQTVPSGSEPDIRITTPGPGRMVVRGTVPEGAKPWVRVQEVEDPAEFARSLFIEALERAGIVVDASSIGGNPLESRPDPTTYTADHRVAVLRSPPFSEEAKLILKVSHNLHASALPLLVAVRHGKRTLADGLHAQHDFLARAGVDVAGISFGGGAGGSPSDFTTPLATVQLLRYMAGRPDFAAFRTALPILGVDGTLATVVGTNSPARGKVSAKTGTLFLENTMNGGYLLTSKALAGYVTTAKGRQLIVALYVNGVHLSTAADSAKIGATLGRICEIIHETE